jgi:starch synthase
MNLVVNDLDMPLIKGSIPKNGYRFILLTMMNILKATFADEEGVMYADNDERAICKRSC